jgi:hypothetical protein
MKIAKKRAMYQLNYDLPWLHLIKGGLIYLDFFLQAAKLSELTSLPENFSCFSFPEERSALTVLQLVRKSQDKSILP